MAVPNGLNPQFNGSVKIGAGTAVTAAGSTGIGLLFSSTSTVDFGIFFGSGAPTITAGNGSLYLNTTGSSTSTRLYVNNGGVTWVAVTTAS
jgi:hypothetical protein